MAKAKKPAKPLPHYDQCKARWERDRKAREAQFAAARAQGKPDDGPDDWKSGARFVTPDPIQSDKSGGDWLVDRPELALDAVPFLATLRSLDKQPRDQRYLDLHRELVMSDLIDRKTGKWSRWGTTLANPQTRFMCELIEETIATRDFSERAAIAEAVAEFGFDAASFDAAWMRVRDLLHAYRKRAC
jgi:hypothetical protein